MKLISILLFVVFFFVACKSENKKIKERITHADSAAINFFTGDGKMDTVVAVKIIKDSKSLDQLVNFISANNKNIQLKCGYDGSIHFFKRNIVVQDIDFRMNDKDCMQFSFMQEGKTVATELTGEAKKLMESFRK